MAMRIKLWGVRGSLPAPPSPQAIESHTRELLEAFLDSKVRKKSEIGKFLETLPPHRFGGFGGNTPCVEVRSDTSQIVIDGGSGIRRFGYECMGGPCGAGTGTVHILLTHFHWDHLIGLPFFVPIFIPGNTVHVYAVQSGLEDVFKTLFKKPYFPVSLDSLGAKIVYHQLEPRKTFQIGDLSVTPYQLDHPDPCWGYKVQHGGRAYAHCVDTECMRVTEEQLGPDLPLYQGIDLMTFDAQYTLMETIEKVNWGHAAASIGLDIAMREGIRKVLFMHHDPASNDEKIAAAETQARLYYNSQMKTAKNRKGAHPLHEVEWLFAREETVVEV